MKKSINLSIAEPCGEKWENFTMTSHGGFCSSCSKTVIDFKNASDEEIIEFFKNKPAHACGRFRADQLKTYSFTKPVVTLHPGMALFKAGLLSLVLLLMSRPSIAQTAPEPTKKEIADRESDQALTVTDDGRIIKGIVLSSDDNSPLAGVNVILKGAAIGTATDADGRFEFPEKLKEGDVLIFSFIGLQTEEYRIPKQSKEVEEIKMLIMELDFDMMGTVAVREIYEEPSGFRKFWTKVKGLF